MIKILTPLFFIGWIILPYFVKIFFENYKDGTNAAQWMLVASLLSILLAYTSIYNVVKEQKDRLFAYLTGIFTWSIVVLIQYSINGFSLDIFPKGMIIGYLSIFLVTLYNINKYKKKY